jgi:hypothetical protein
MEARTNTCWLIDVIAANIDGSDQIVEISTDGMEILRRT